MTTPTPDPEARCPYCGGATLTPFVREPHASVECEDCFARGPRTDYGYGITGHEAALTAFTRPSHALASASALLREARDAIRDSLLLHGCGDESDAACERDVKELLSRYPHIVGTDPELLFQSVKAKSLGILGRIEAAISTETT